jgi:cysteine desulfurase/selenocysteine lyase
MSTQRPDPVATEANTADPFDTALISRLVKEFYAETASGAPATSGAPSGSLGDFSGITPAGSVPPVHPSVQPPLEKSEESSPEHYAFGEPNPDSWRLKGLRGEQLDPYPNSSEASQGSRDGSGLYFLPDFRDASTESAATYPTFDSGLPHFSLPFAKAGAPLAGFDVEKVRRDFPALHQKVNGRDLIWFDNAATTHKPQSVIDAISLFYSRDNSNVNRAAHTLARRATDIYEGAREKVREFIGAGDTDEIIFVRGTTEAINLVAQTFGRQRIGAGDEILLTTMEHHANIVPWKMLSEQTGANIRVAPINDRGELLLGQFASLLSERTKIVAITHVSNALGTINPLEEVIALAHAYGIPVLVDGAQSTPHLPVNVQALDADFFAFSGHKIFGPTGIGILYGKREFLETIPPYQGGGSMIEDVTFSKITYAGIPQKFEAGTQDIAAVAGLAAAIDYVLGIGLPAIAAYEHELLEYATAELRGIPGIRQIGTAASKASVLSFIVNGVESEKVGTYLDEHGVAVRAGHHCAQPSLRRFGVETAVRPSFAFYNTREEIDVLIRALHQLPKR